MTRTEARQTARDATVDLMPRPETATPTSYEGGWTVHMHTGGQLDAIVNLPDNGPAWIVAMFATQDGNRTLGAFAAA